MTDPTKKNVIKIGWRKKFLNWFDPKPIQEVEAEEMNINFDKEKVDQALKELVRGAKKMRMAAEDVRRVSEDFVGLTAKLLAQDLRGTAEGKSNAKVSTRSRTSK